MFVFEQHWMILCCLQLHNQRVPTPHPHGSHPTESETFANLPDQPVTKPSMSAGDKLRMAMIAGVPVALLVIGLGARIYYLHVRTGVAGLGGCVFGCFRVCLLLCVVIYSGPNTYHLEQRVVRQGSRSALMETPELLPPAVAASPYSVPTCRAVPYPQIHCPELPAPHHHVYASAEPCPELLLQFPLIQCMLFVDSLPRCLPTLFRNGLS